MKVSVAFIQLTKGTERTAEFALTISGQPAGRGSLSACVATAYAILGVDGMLAADATIQLPGQEPHPFDFARTRAKRERDLAAANWAKPSRVGAALQGGVDAAP